MKFEVENGTFTYSSIDRTVLKNINFSVEDGDTLAVLGPNGAGKTTLLRCAMGLLKWKSGKTLLNGIDICHISTKEFWKQISYVPQAKGVPVSYTAEEMVLLGRSSSFGMFSLPQKDDVKKVEEIMDKLNILHMKNKKCNELSGGEMQMVLIARAMASDPKIIILDEPESNLDFKNQLIVLDTLTKLSQEGIACIFNTHYPVHALRRAKKSIMISKSGECIMGKTRDVVTEHNIEKFFGVQAVMGSIETPDKVYTDVVAVGPAREKSFKDLDNSNKIAVVSIIFKNRDDAETINKIIHSYTQYIISRMGLPYRSAEVYIINLTIDAPMTVTSELTDRLNLLSDVSVKATYAKEQMQHE